jgi:hypothetical protein
MREVSGAFMNRWNESFHDPGLQQKDLVEEQSHSPLKCDSSLLIALRAV